MSGRIRAKRSMASIAIGCLMIGALTHFGASAQSGSPAQPGATMQRSADLPRQLLVRQASFNIGRDGVERETRHATRMVRTDDTIWIEREWPAAMRRSADHGHSPDHGAAQGGHGGHAHEAAQFAPLLLRRDAQGKVDVQSVLHDQRRIIHVDLAHYGSIGYGGSWEAAWSLLDPRALTTMRKVGAVRNGVQRYESHSNERTTQVDWDVAAQYARQISVRHDHGTSWQTMTATPQAQPTSLPWQGLDAYSHGDYSDLLD